MVLVDLLRFECWLFSGWMVMQLNLVNDCLLGRSKVDLDLLEAF
jgi:hypothetical protein